MNDNSRTELEQFFASCPDVLSVTGIHNWTTFRLSRIYNLVYSGELPSCRYRGIYLIRKMDLLDYLEAHRNDPPEERKPLLKSPPPVHLTTKEKRAALEHLLEACPDAIRICAVPGFSHLGRNKIHALMQSGELPGYPYRGTYLIPKKALLRYMLKHMDDPRPLSFARKEEEPDEDGTFFD